MQRANRICTKNIYFGLISTVNLQVTALEILTRIRLQIFSTIIHKVHMLNSRTWQFSLKSVNLTDFYLNPYISKQHFKKVESTTSIKDLQDGRG